LVGAEFPADQNPTGILVSKSVDGGLTWAPPTTIAADVKEQNDKPTITADPTNPQFVYATCTRFHNLTGFPFFCRTTAGGQSWEAPRALFNPGGNNWATGGQIVVLPNGTLVDVFAQVLYKNNNSGHAPHYDLKLVLLRSTDHGQTWLSSQSPIPI